MSRTTPAGTPLGDGFHVFDTTLRDGAQREGITYSVDGQAGGGPAAGRDRRRLHRGRLAGRTAQGHRVLRPCGGRRAGAAARAAGRLRLDPQGRRQGRGRPAGAGAAGRADAGRHAWSAKSDRRHIERALRTTLEENLRHGPRHRAFLVGKAAGCSSTRSILRRLRARPGRARARAAGGRSTRAPTWGCCATPTAACCRCGSGEIVAEVRRPHRLAGSASTARTTPAARWPTPRRGRGRRHPRPVHGQRLRRAGRQRRPVRGDRQPRDQDGLPVRARRAACPS